MNYRLGLVLGMIAMPVFADTMSRPVEPISIAKDGLYVGIGAGAAFDEFKFSTFGTTNGILRTVNTNTSSPIGNIFAGYGATFNNNFYVGAELGTDFPSRNSDFPRLNASISGTSIDHLTTRDYISWDVLSGIRVNSKFLIYGRLGVAYSKLIFNQDANPSMSVPAFRNQFNQLSGRLGTGINYQAYKHFSVGVDYIYMDYQVFTGSYPGFKAEFREADSTNYVGFSIMYTF